MHSSLVKKGFASLSETEAAVCGRFKISREEAGVTQERIGLHMGLTRNQIANIESKRVPLRFWPGWKFCAELDINASWLARGVGPLRPCIDYFKQFSADESLGHPEDDIGPTFARGFEIIEYEYDRLFLEFGFVKRPGKGIEKSIQRPIHSGGVYHRKALTLLVDSWLSDLPPEQRDPFLAFLIESAYSFKEQRPKKRGR